MELREGPVENCGRVFGGEFEVDGDEVGDGFAAGVCHDEF